MRNSADVVGYLCSRTASTQCSDCGSKLCESHTETCSRMPLDILPVLLFLPSSAAFEARARRTSGAKKSLESAYAEIAFWSGCLFNFISFICSSVIGTISGDRHDSAPIEFVFCLAEVGRAENVGTE